MRRDFTFLLSVHLMTLLVASADAGLIINTTGTTNGSIGLFGEFSSGTPATFGQTFTVTAADPVLDEFAFYVTKNSTHPDFLDYSFHVAEWNGLRAVSPPLFSTSPQSTTNNAGAGGTEEIRFQINQTLVPGTKYVAFVTAEGQFDGVAGGVGLDFAGSGSAYAGGELVYAERLDNFNALFSSTWFRNTTHSLRDVHFEAVFSAAPEPSGMTLLWVGVSLVAMRRRRKVF